jgi:hypothetical protein
MRCECTGPDLGGARRTAGCGRLVGSSVGWLARHAACNEWLGALRTGWSSLQVTKKVVIQARSLAVKILVRKISSVIFCTVHFWSFSNWFWCYYCFFRVKVIVGAIERTKLLFGRDCHHFVDVWEQKKSGCVLFVAYFGSTAIQPSVHDITNTLRLPLL